MEKPKILAIEDSPDTQRELKRVFTRLGCDVVQAFSAEDGLEKLKSGLAVDVVILDFKLPGMSGPQLYQELNKNEAWKSLPVIPFTSLMSDKFNGMGLDWIFASQQDPSGVAPALPIVPKGKTGEGKSIMPQLIISVA